MANPNDQLVACESSVAKNPRPIASQCPKILIVLVRYQTFLQDSQTMRTLGSCLAADTELGQHFSTLVLEQYAGRDTDGAVGFRISDANRVPA